jgi:Xaa-Pro aminopeptidase
MASPEKHAERRRRAAAALAGLSADALLVTSLPNLRYLTGFSGSAAMLLLQPEKGTLITDSRYVLQAESEARGLELVRTRDGYERTVTEEVGVRGIRRLAYEAAHLRVSQHQFLASSAAGAFELVSSHGVVEELRLLKDPEEAALLRRAAAGLQSVLGEWRKHLAPGVRELDLAAELDYRLRRSGFERVAFETIVASGERSALPHGRPTVRALGPGDLVVVDFGGIWGGYASDMTRTFSIGPPKPAARQIYEVTADAQQAALNQVRPGISAGAVDRAAREVIEAAGYGEFFGHGTGHGLGLEVHEPPWIRAGAEQVLQPGMAFTVEPGIYLPGSGGVRLEDDVLVTENGAEVLTRESSRDGSLRDFPWVC